MIYVHMTGWTPHVLQPVELKLGFNIFPGMKNFIPGKNIASFPGTGKFPGNNIVFDFQIDTGRKGYMFVDTFGSLMSF